MSGSNIGHAGGGANAVDTSSLAWVLGEIRHSLHQSTQALHTFVESGDPTQLKGARTALHQAHGALQIVGVDGVSILTEEVEQLYEQFEREPKSCSEPARQAIARAFQAVIEYLEELQRGAQHHPVLLFPYFKDLLLVRGADRIHPADLFFPDLSLRPAKTEPLSVLTSELLSRERARFERGLLYFLRDRQDIDSVQSMLSAVSTIEATQRATAHRTFWWVTKAFLEALYANALPADLNVQRLCARINLQMRRLLDESAPIAERLLKDTLFFVARSNANSPTIQAVKDLFKLDGLVPDDFETAKYGKTNVHVVNQIRERVETAKQAWNRLVGGMIIEVNHFANETNALQNIITELQQPGLIKLSQALFSIAQNLQKSTRLPNELLGLEIATALLLMEGVLDNLGSLDEQFNQRIDIVVKRLYAVEAGEEPAENLDWLDEISRRAQERLSLLSVIREIQNGLSETEKIIDAFFRDPTQRDDLAACQPALAQIAGAFTLLGQPAAVALVKHLQEDLERFSVAQQVPPPNILEGFAREYGALGFLTETLLHTPDSSNTPYEFDALTAQFKASEIPRPFDALTSSGQTVSAENGGESDLAFVAHSPLLLEEKPADLLPPLVVPDEAYSIRLENDGASVEASNHPIPLPLIPTIPISDSQQDVDAELLEIFLGEATEVLETIVSAHQLCQSSPNDQEQLTLIRRGFHTLKGSSRMVGLTQFGEAAWGCEQTLNAWLSERRSVSPELLFMLTQAEHKLGEWVKDLQQFGQSHHLPDDLVLLARQVRSGEPIDMSSTLEEMPTLPSLDLDGTGQLVVDSVGQEASIPAPLASPVDLSNFVEVEPISSSGNEITPENTDASTTENVLEKSSFEDQAVKADNSNVSESVDVVLANEPLETTFTSQSASVISIVPPEPLSTARDETVYIGDMPVSAPLYNIFLAEADDLVRQLERDFAEWRHELRPVSFLAQRSIHSLAGIAGTVGFKDLRDVALLLEDCLGLMANQHLLPTDVDLNRLDAVIEHIRGMLQQFAAGVLPLPAEEWLKTLANWQAVLNNAAQITEVVEAQDLDNDPSVVSTPESLSVPAVEAVQPAIQEASESLAPSTSHVDIPDSILKNAEEMSDDIDPELLAVFLEEASDYLPQIGTTLRTWQAHPEDTQQGQSLLRQLHTIKGSARMAGAMRLGQLIHEMETRVEPLSTMPVAPLSVLDELLNAHDQTLYLFDQLMNPVPPQPSIDIDLISDEIIAEDIQLEPELKTEGTNELLETVSAPVTLKPIVLPQAPTNPIAVPLVNTPANNPQPQAQVRVRADLLDRLVNQAGEVSISRARVETEVTLLRGALTDLTENVGRLRAQLREIEIQAESQMQSQLNYAREHEGQFDPLEFDRFTRFQELTRMMAESVNDVSTLQTNLVKGVEKAQEGLLIQARNTRELQQDLMSVRMVQFGSISERLYRVVRQASKELDKRVHLDIRGANVELDRGVLERMVGPFEHLLRNAVVHGIETRAERLSKGKHETGELLIEVRQEGGEVVLTFGDDGAGLNVGQIRARALSQGLLSEDREITDREATEFIFTPGFSTASEVTELAGRGVGMDVVKFEAAELGGRVSLDFSPNKGSRFTIHLPLTLAVTQVVLVRVGEKVFALPSVLVEQVQQLKPQTLANAYNAGYVEWLGEKVIVRYLATLLGDFTQTPMAQRYSPMIVLRSGIQRLALHVDEILGNQEAVVKNMGPQLARVPGIAGATVMGSGEIVLILNPVQLAEQQGEAAATIPDLRDITDANALGAVAELHAGQGKTATVQGLNTTPTIMVVDDSLTVRRVTQRLLQREGYQVVLAKDGVDALRQVQDITPDIMLVDIEMPRMDGFDLTRNVRSDERIKHVPIIMITSRTAEKHRNYALSIGVNVYLGKPYQEDELLKYIGEFVGERKPKVMAN